MIYPAVFYDNRIAKRGTFLATRGQSARQTLIAKKSMSSSILLRAVTSQVISTANDIAANSLFGYTSANEASSLRNNNMLSTDLSSKYV